MLLLPLEVGLVVCECEWCVALVAALCSLVTAVSAELDFACAGAAGSAFERVADSAVSREEELFR